MNTTGTRKFVVEIRSVFEVEAESPDAALRLLRSSGDRHSKPVSTEFLVRERLEHSVFTQDPDLHGLTKPVYTVQEAASILGIGRSTIYELTRRADGGCIRLGRKILYYIDMGNKRVVPRRAVEVFLEGKSPMVVVEENIAYCREKYPIEEHTERIERELREAWS
jgi:excisionase family DNA binding protein